MLIVSIFILAQVPAVEARPEFCNRIISFLAIPGELAPIMFFPTLGASFFAYYYGYHLRHVDPHFPYILHHTNLVGVMGFHALLGMLMGRVSAHRAREVVAGQFILGQVLNIAGELNLNPGQSINEFRLDYPDLAAGLVGGCIGSAVCYFTYRSVPRVAKFFRQAKRHPSH